MTYVFLVTYCKQRIIGNTMSVIEGFLVYAELLFRPPVNTCLLHISFSAGEVKVCDTQLCDVSSPVVDCF